MLKIKFRRLYLAFVFVLIMILFSNVKSAAAQSKVNIQVGVWGDDSSKGNTGISVEIKTKSYSVSSPDVAEAFWVGENLDNGAFIQFGYIIEPGYYCAQGSTIYGCSGGVHYGASDAYWFWEYWPISTTNDYYFANGPPGFLIQGSWHTYRIQPDAVKGWDFVLDGQTLSRLPQFQWTISNDVVTAVAEEVTSSSIATGNLGPVEFRNLSYLKTDGWHAVITVTAIHGCGYANPSCGGVTNPYGVSVLGPNDILAGAGMTLRSDGDLLWTSGPVLLLEGPRDATFVVNGVTATTLKPMALNAGAYEIAVSDSVEVNDSMRLVFDHWSNGAQTAAVQISLTSNLTLQAIYLPQYKLTIESDLPTNGEGWYDKGTVANVSTVSSPRFTSNFNYQVFEGWYSNGKEISTSTSYSLLMNQPYTLTGVWNSYHIDWSVIITVIAIIAILGLAVYIISPAKRKRSENEVDR